MRRHQYQKIFLGSAPSASVDQPVPGASKDEVRLLQQGVRIVLDFGTRQVLHAIGFAANRTNAADVDRHRRRARAAVKSKGYGALGVGCSIVGNDITNREHLGKKGTSIFTYVQMACRGRVVEGFSVV